MYSYLSTEKGTSCSSFLKFLVHEQPRVFIVVDLLAFVFGCFPKVGVRAFVDDVFATVGWKQCFWKAIWKQKPLHSQIVLSEKWPCSTAQLQHGISVVLLMRLSQANFSFWFIDIRLVLFHVSSMLQLFCSFNKNLHWDFIVKTDKTDYLFLLLFF